MVRRDKLVGYLLAVALFAAALGLRIVVGDGLPDGFPFLTFFPAVLVTAFLGGLGPGILCATLSTLAAWYFFIPPFNSFGLSHTTIVALAFFVAIMVVDIVIIDQMTRALEKLKREQAVTASLLDRQKTLFAELQHRVANNLAFVASLLSLQSRKLAHNREAVAAMDEARLRLETMSRIHRRLYDPERLDAPLGSFIQDICDDLVRSGGSKARCRVDVVDAALPPERIITLSLIVVEAITNSLKHALRDREDGLITVKLGRDGDNYALAVSDDGPGLPDGFDPSASKSLGMRILQGFARTLGGQLEFRTDNGLTTRVVFPQQA